MPKMTKNTTFDVHIFICLPFTEMQEVFFVHEQLSRKTFVREEVEEEEEQMTRTENLAVGKEEAVMEKGVVVPFLRD